MDILQKARAAFKNILGTENFLSDSATLSRYATTTFATSIRVEGVLLPSCTEDIQQIVRAANELRVSLYPVSTGKNYGLGSRVPTSQGCFVIDFKRMNKIIELNRELSYVTLEPGVTFLQLSEYLKANQPDLYLPATGGPPLGSPIGNAIERGDGVGPGGDRSNFAAGVEVVLPNGEAIKTGFGALANSKVTKLARYGLGPALEGLFFQSNLGIVTRMTLWLRKKPAVYQVILFSTESDEQISPIIEDLRCLQERGVVQQNSIALYNWHKFLQSEMQYPYDKITGAKVTDLRSALPPFWRKTRWFAAVGLYSASRLHAFADKRLVMKALRGRASWSLTLNARSAKILPLFHARLSKVWNIDIKRLVRTFYSDTIYLGVPNEINLRSVYWRKRNPRPTSLDPDRDRCGALWLCQTVPDRAEDIIEATKIVDLISEKHGFEPNISLMNCTQWSYRFFAITNYDRDEPGEDARAFACHREIGQALNDAGYTSYRLGIQSFDAMPFSDAGYIELLRTIKTSLDPQDVVAPGRYDFRHLWNQETLRSANDG
ncbi:MAG: FAD-binding oxidoreductase [Deltaproteobacteria bacterium]|nr:FAD-binding oxidoreductase [Deltaproteobacteria bacterium]